MTAACQSSAVLYIYCYSVQVNNQQLFLKKYITVLKIQNLNNLLFQVNVLGLCICTREAFQQMQKNKVDDGHIILINSLSGHRVVPNAAGHFYSVTKCAVSAILEGIRNELHMLNSHIRVSSVSPGIVATEFHQRMYKSPEVGKRICSRMKCLEGEDLANAVIYALSAPAHVQVHDILVRSIEQKT